MNEGNLNPEAYMAKHKKAFRVAFDYLNAHFPPQESADWWVQAASDMADAVNPGVGDNPLTAELVLGVYNYLEKEWKKRYEETKD